MKIENFVIDPPWSRSKGGLRKSRPNQSKNLDYPTMSVEEIFSLLDKEIFIQAADTHNVFLWLIDKYLFEGEQEMQKRGYKLHARFIWDKGNGVAPAFTVRYSHEYLIWFYKPKLLPIEKNQRGKFTTVINSPGREHSRKPDESYKMIDAIYPKSIKMDVFSRESREGWHQFGNDIEKFN